MGVDLIRRFAAVLAQIARVAFDRFAFVVADALRVGLYKTAIENTPGQAFVVVGFDCFEIMDRDSGLIADFAWADTACLACESQLFADTRCCHLQSLVSRWLGGPRKDSHFFGTIAWLLNGVKPATDRRLPIVDLRQGNRQSAIGNRQCL